MLLGYADRLSVAQGGRIRFMVSCEQPTYASAVVRLTGFDRRSAPLPGTVASGRPGREQALRTGSYGLISAELMDTRDRLDVTVQLWLMPTTPLRGRPQAIVSRGSPSADGFGLWIEPDGHLAFGVASAAKPGGSKLRSPTALVAWEWYFVAATYNTGTGQARLVQRPLAQWGIQPRPAVVQAILGRGGPGGGSAPLLLAAARADSDSADRWATSFFNGKLDSPRLFSRELALDEIARLESGAPPAEVGGDALLGAWDFARDVASLRLVDTSGNERHGRAINTPTRGMTGHAWTAEVLDLPQAPEQWSAIHFHEDDLEDAGWTPGFEWTVPEEVQSGVYAAVLTAGDQTECVPFFVRRKRGGETARIAFLAPTMTYVAYANYRQSAEAGEQMSGSNIYAYMTDRPIQLSPTDAVLEAHPELGLCHYENHRDGSASYYSSRLRPILTMRPGYGYWMTHGPRHFAADLLLVEWLEDRPYDWDVITDEDLHAEGDDLLNQYRVLITGSHPEYWTDPMLRGLEAYLDRGGHLMYLGGNGLCWVTSVYPQCPHVFEVRKGVFFVPMGNGVAGESCHSTTGERGGAWRDRGRAPQRLLGVGTTAMGWGPAPGYVRQAGSFDERAAFIFEGIGPDEVIGDFGLVLGGAAGDEIDRLDHSLGSPPHTLLLASSSGRHSDHFQLLPWDVQTFLLGHGGTEDARVRADMTYLETANGGAVFSVGSINWIGSLMFNMGANNVSVITDNVLRRFAS